MFFELPDRHRHHLTMLVHAMKGDAMQDHTDHVIWLGPSETLDLAAHSREAGPDGITMEPTVAGDRLAPVGARNWMR